MMICIHVKLFYLKKWIASCQTYEQVMTCEKVCKDWLKNYYTIKEMALQAVRIKLGELYLSGICDPVDK